MSVVIGTTLFDSPSVEGGKYTYVGTFGGARIYTWTPFARVTQFDNEDYSMILVKNGDVTTKWGVLVRNATTFLGATGAATVLGANAYIGKQGGSLAAVGGTFTEDDATKAPGLYLYTPASGETNTNGPLRMGIAASTGLLIATAVPIQVVAFDPTDAVRAGLTAMPNANAASSGGLLTSGTGANQIAVDGSGNTASNILKVNSDTTTMTNLANTFNGTGYQAPTGPAQQQQVANIAVTGAALNTVAASATYTTGSSTGGYTNTFTADGSYDSVTDTAGTVDFYYQFSLAGTNGAVAVGANWLGYVVGAANTIKVFAFNWGGSSWDQVGTIAGGLGTANQELDLDLTSAHTGTGINIGLVRIRFQNTGLTTSTTKTDRILVGYAVVATLDSSGYTLASVQTIGSTPLTSIENQIWNALESAHTTSGSYGEHLAAKASTVSSGTNGATTFSTNLGTPAANAYKNEWLFFLSGTLVGQSQQVASNDASGNITMATAFTTAPSNTDRFILIGK